MMSTATITRGYRRLLVYGFEVALALAFFLLSCGDASTGPEDGAGAAAGSYTLTTINGQTLPASFEAATGVIVRVTSGTFTLNGADNGYRYESSWEEIAGGQTTFRGENCAGSWTRTGNTFFITEDLTPVCGGTYTAVWDGGDRLTVTFSPALVSVFTR